MHQQVDVRREWALELHRRLAPSLSLCCHLSFSHTLVLLRRFAESEGLGSDISFVFKIALSRSNVPQLGSGYGDAMMTF
jgi:hypothetical protein